MKGRIYFENNPWPEGHKIKAFELSCALTLNGIALNLHLVSEDYYAERDIETWDENGDILPDYEDLSSWESPVVWNNYAACKLSNTFWGSEGPLIMVSETGQKFCIDDLAGKTFKANTVPKLSDGIADPDFLWQHTDMSFHIYLLGHDAVADHAISFSKNAAGNFDIKWTGLIALAYVGQTHFKHKFEAQIKDVPFLGYICPPSPNEKGQEKSVYSAKEQKEFDHSLARKYLSHADNLIYHPGNSVLKPNIFTSYHIKPSLWP